MPNITSFSPRPRDLDPINWLGLQTLVWKEIKRFIKVYPQTIVAPVVTTLLYYIVFDLALGGAGRMVGPTPYLYFLTPGLIMMSMAQNAFANSSSSIVISKVQGNIVDVLMPPLSALELTIGFTIGGLARGLAVGLVSLVTLSFWAHLPVSHPSFILFHAVFGSMLLSLLGVIGGIWSEKFDHMATVQNFIIMPATFLSGTFYAADRLPGAWQLLCHLNPFFYMIDGFRYGFIGVPDDNLTIGLFVVGLSDIVLLLVAYRMFATGYKLKS